MNLETIELNNEIVHDSSITADESIFKQIVASALCLGTWGIHFGIQHKICLLYTSPSPRDLSTSRMPSSA